MVLVPGRLGLHEEQFQIGGLLEGGEVVAGLDYQPQDIVVLATVPQLGSKLRRHRRDGQVVS